MLSNSAPLIQNLKCVHADKQMFKIQYNDTYQVSQKIWER